MEVYDQYLYEQAMLEEETRKEREGLFPGITLNGHGIHEDDLPYDDDYSSEDGIIDDKYAEYNDMPMFEKIR